MGCGGCAPSPPCLFCIQIAVCLGEQLFDSLAIAAVHRNADTRGKRRLLVVASQHFANAAGDAPRFILLSFRQDQSEFVTPITRSGVNSTAVNPQNIPKTADGAAAHEVTVVVVNCFQAIQIEKKYGERTAAAVGALGLIFQDIEQTPVVRQAGERIADAEMADLFEEMSIVKESAAECNRVTHHHKRLGKNERRVQQTLGLRGRKLNSDVEPSRGVNGAIEG